MDVSYAINVDQRCSRYCNNNSVCVKYRRGEGRANAA